MTTIRRARVLRLATAGPQDTAPLAAAMAAGEVDPATIVAIVGKTEGNGCVNDFTRGYATLALKLLLAESLKCAPSEIDGGSPSSCRAAPRAGSRRICWCSAARPRRNGRDGQAARHRRRPDARLRARGDRPRGADRSDGVGRLGRHEGCRHRRAAGRAFRPDQVPAAHQGAHRGGRAAWRHDGDRRHLSLDGPLARRLGTGRRGGAGRGAGGGRDQVRDLPRLVALLQGRQHVGRRRASAQRDRRAGQCRRLGRRPGDRP